MSLSQFLTLQPFELPSLLPTEAHLWHLQFSLLSPQIILMLKEFLSGDEQQRLASLKGEKNQHTFIISRGVLRFLLGHYLQSSPTDISLCYGVHGKPFSKNSHLSFNLSHSGDVLLLAFTQHARIGVDVEQIRPLPSFSSLMEVRFSETERLHVLTLPSDQQLPAFFHIWTKKEAYLKALGRGFAFPIPMTSFTSSPEEVFSFKGETGQRWEGRTVSLDHGYASTLVLEETRALKYYALNLQRPNNE